MRTMRCFRYLLILLPLVLLGCETGPTEPDLLPLTGEWHGTGPDVTVDMQLTQVGDELTGSGVVTIEGGDPQEFAVDGEVIPADDEEVMETHVTLRFHVEIDAPVYRFEGTVDADGRIRGEIWDLNVPELFRAEVVFERR